MAPKFFSFPVFAIFMIACLALLASADLPKFHKRASGFTVAMVGRDGSSGSGSSSGDGSGSSSTGTGGNAGYTT